MGTNKGNRPADSEVYSESVEQEEVLVEGWCELCICKTGYHIGDSEGTCVECGCKELILDEDADLLDRLKGLIVYSIEDDSLDYEPEVDREEETSDLVLLPLSTRTVFIGKASRECELCGASKLHKEFNNSKDPKVLCNYCAWEEAEFSMLEAMEDKQRYEIEEMEERILENEMAYQESLDRQEMLDFVLSQLDE